MNQKIRPLLFLILTFGAFIVPEVWTFAEEDSFSWILQESQKIEGGRVLRNRTTKFELERVGEEIEPICIQLRKGGMRKNPEFFLDLFHDNYQGNFFLQDSAHYKREELGPLIQKSLDGSYETVRESFFKLRDFHENQAWELKALVRLKVDLRVVTRNKEYAHILAGWWFLLVRDTYGEPWKIYRSTLSYWNESKENYVSFKPVTQATGLKLFSPPTEEIIKVVSDRKRHESEATHFEYGGIAVGDFNGDHYPDIFIPNAYGRDLLYKNNQNSTFTEIGEPFFKDKNAASRGAVFADVDNDGDQDLFITRSGFPFGRLEREKRAGNAFYRNENGIFVNRTKEAGLEFVGHSFTPIFFDYDNDGDLDLYIGNYANKDTLEDSLDARNGEPNLLYENLGNGTFKNVAEEAGVAGNGWSFAVAVCDYNLDGHMDIYVANDFGVNNLYENLGNKTFKEISVEKGVEDRGYGMGVTFGDFNNDQRWDIYISSMYSNTGKRVLSTQADLDSKSYEMLNIFTRGNSLFMGLPENQFKYVGAEYGVNSCGWAWHADFFDYDSDGDEDLLVANGYITGNSEKDY